MTGLEKILDQIEQEASSVAQQKRKAAEVQAAKIREDAEAEAGKQVRQIQEKSEADCRNYQERVKSRAQFQKRTVLLEAKQEIISDMIGKAYESMCNAPEEAYFGYMERLLEEFVLPQTGEIRFNRKDRERLPESFRVKITQTAKEKGGSLQISKIDAAIESGFLLIYGDIEENCTFRSLFSEKQEQLQDKVRTFLFAS